MPLFLDRLMGRRDLLIPHLDIHTIAPDADDSSLLTPIQRLRYEVYCVEQGFLDAAAYPDGIESDEHDASSAHVAVRAPDGKLVGTVRLVCPREGQAFPFEAQCRVFEHVVLPPRAQAAEVSRLIVHMRFRRSADAAGTVRPAGAPPRSGWRRLLRPAAQRGSSPLLLLGMYRAMYRYSVANGIGYWYAAMEGSLARSLEKMGFPLVPIGPEGDYYGPVTLHMVDLRDLERRVAAASPFMLAWFQGGRVPFWLLVKTLAGWLWRGRRRRS